MIQIQCMDFSLSLLAILEGYLVGLSLVILIGPVFFVLLHSTLEYGIKSGLAVAFGIFVSDVFIVWLCFQGGDQWIKIPWVHQGLTGGGALIVFMLGIRYLMTSPQTLLAPPALNTKTRWALFLKGCAVNLINPFVFMVWFGILSTAQHRYPLKVDQIAFLSSTIAGILTLDLSKVYLAQWIKHFLSEGRLKWILRGSGVILIGFGCRLIYVFF